MRNCSCQDDLERCHILNDRNVCYNTGIMKSLIFVGVLVFIVVAAKLFELILRGRKSAFDYARKDCVMTPAERECFLALLAEMGVDYHFFPQVHLDSIVAPRVSGSKRFAAFRHINQKSVDFVACDKKNLRPLFAIELDDKTHSQRNRIKRDREVARILQGAGIPLVRIENRGRFEPKALAQLVQRGIGKYATAKLE